jgi:hypothetical protein
VKRVPHSHFNAAGRGKRRFSEHGAQAEVERLKARGGNPEAYWCITCRRYHVGNSSLEASK